MLIERDPNKPKFIEDIEFYLLNTHATNVCLFVEKDIKNGAGTLQVEVNSTNFLDEAKTSAIVSEILNLVVKDHESVVKYVKENSDDGGLYVKNPVAKSVPVDRGFLT